MTTFNSNGITQVEYIIYWHRGDGPIQSTTMSAPLDIDYEELESKARAVLNRKHGGDYTIDAINVNYDFDAMFDEICNTVKSLDRYEDYHTERVDGQLFFYGDEGCTDLKEVFDVEEAVNEVIDHYERTGNSEAEIRYDGTKFFTQEVIF